MGGVDGVDGVSELARRGLISYDPPPWTRLSRCLRAT